MNEGWFALLKARIAAASLRQVAAELGYSGTTLSLIVHGKYAGKTDRVAAAVAAAPGAAGSALAAAATVAGSSDAPVPDSG